MIDDSRADERTGRRDGLRERSRCASGAALVFATDRFVIAYEYDGPVTSGSNRIQMQLVTQWVVVFGIELVAMG